SGSQADFMLRDECLIVDDSDALMRTSNKADCHRFNAAQPRGLLHRAFSVFLFSPDGRLLLQQRAAAKVTFPSVWTNTCCSHPLAGQQPDEVDAPEHIADGSVPGIKAAAIRKLEHELGIAPSQLPPSAFTFLTRLHYCAADTDTHGPNAEWGEHEIDYVLFVRPSALLELAPNPEEVDAVRYVTLRELRTMMAADSGLRWSPWFRILADRFLAAWWADLDATLRDGTPADRATIHHIL
ncbi:Isopentenyl-diphosphate Delta-isomerase, partial [Tetrabaena socialis]